MNGYNRTAGEIAHTLANLYPDSTLAQRTRAVDLYAKVREHDTDANRGEYLVALDALVDTV